MGYQILYESGGIKTKIPSGKKKQRKSTIEWAMILLPIVLLLALVKNSGFRRFILPGNKDVTEAAIIRLVDSIQRGDHLDEAVTAFCRQIIENKE